MFGKRKEKIELLEEKSKFADGIKGIWVHENYVKIKEAHNEVVSLLKEKNFDFFSMQYLLTITYMELLVNEYLVSHKEEIQKQLMELMKQ